MTTPTPLCGPQHADATQPTRRAFHRRVLAGAAVALGAAHPAARAQSEPYPAKPITLVVPFPPGGVGDGGARIAAKAMADRLNQPIVIDNRTGAGGAIGTQFVARARADGYTLLYGSSGPMVGNLFLMKDVGYHPLRNFVPVYGLTSTPMVLAVNAERPYRSFAELLAFAKQNPGKLNAGHHGVGTGAHLGGVLLGEVTGMQWKEVAYRGEGPALVDLMAGTIDLGFAYPTSVAQHVAAGKLRLLATTAAARLPTLPELPTFAELGHRDLVFSPWNGIFAPPGTPLEIVAALARTAAAALRDEGVQQWMPKAGAVALDLPPERFSAFIETEIPRFKRLVEISGATPQ